MVKLQVDAHFSEPAYQQCCAILQEQRASPVLYISLPSLYDYDVKMPKFTFYKTWTQDNDFFKCSFVNLYTVHFFRIQLLKKSPTFDKLEELEFETARIHFFRDVFAAVAVVVA